jgi:uncharacterized protein YdaU (DUF1376 family)
MHYYQFNISDYMSHTRHLTPIEDICYRRLLDWQYLHEKPVPADLKAICRLLMLRDYQEDVEQVLNEFFILTEEGWINQRAFEEIDEFLFYEDKSQAKEENEKERKRRHREERKRLFSDLREKGVIPGWKTLTEPLRELHRIHCGKKTEICDKTANYEHDIKQERACDAPGTELERACDAPGTAITTNYKPLTTNQELLTINQEPLSNNQEPLKTFTPPPNPPEGGSAVLSDSGSIDPSSSSPVAGGSAEKCEKSQKITENPLENSGKKPETDARNRPQNIEESNVNTQNPPTETEKPPGELTVVAKQNPQPMLIVGKEAPKKPKNHGTPETLTSETWDAYAVAYEQRYGATPVRNATVSGQLAHFVKRIGRDESPHVARFFVFHNSQYYVKKMHAVGVMLADAEKLRTEWATNRSITETQARQIDRKQTTSNVFNQLLEECRNGNL